MKKTGIAIAAIAVVTVAGLFAQPAKGKKAETKPLPPAPEFKAPPKIELPAEADVKAYHQAQRDALKILLDAQVKAKIITPEWAEAKMAILKAVQADCKGFCIIKKSTDIPFGAPAFGPKPHFGGPCPRGDFKPTHDMKGRDHKRRHPNGRPGFDPSFNADEDFDQEPDTSAIQNER